MYNQATALQVRLNTCFIKSTLTCCLDSLQSIAFRIPAGIQGRQAESKSRQTKERSTNKGRGYTTRYPPSATVLAWQAFRRECTEGNGGGQAEAGVRVQAFADAST